MLRRRLAVALLVGLLGLLAVAATAGSVGVTWDEAIYMRTARRYMSWFAILRYNTVHGRPAAAFSPDTIAEYWGPAGAQPDKGRVEDIHPPLTKVAAGLAWRLTRSVIGNLVGMRLIGAVLFGLLLGTLFLWVSEVYGPLAGTAAALCLGLMPRFFLQANLLALDLPLAALSFIATYVYWKTVRLPGLRWAVLFGMVWGLAVAGKNGGWLLPVGLGVWTLVYYRTWQHVVRLAVAGVVAALVFVVTWPWLYTDTLDHLRHYGDVAFLGHAELLHQWTYYLGHVYQMPPWHYPLVITAAVVPSGILILVIIGILAGARSALQGSSLSLHPAGGTGRDSSLVARGGGRRDSPVLGLLPVGGGDAAEQQGAGLPGAMPMRAGRGGAGSTRPVPHREREHGQPVDSNHVHALFILSALGPMLPFLLRIVAAYDGERLFLSSFPFLAALGGIGFVHARHSLWRLVWRRVPRLAARRQNGALQGVLTAALLLAVFVSPLVSMIRLHPYQLSYYSELVGGLSGAVRLGLEVTYWADSYQGVLEYVNQNTPPQAVVWADAYQVLWTYQQLGRLRKDIIVSGATTPSLQGAHLAIVQARPSRYFEPIAQLMAGRRPVFTVTAGGVPLAWVYQVR